MSAYSYLIALGAASFSGSEQHKIIYKAFVSLFQASMHDAQLQQIVVDCSQQFISLLGTKLRKLCHQPLKDDTLEKLSQLILMSLDGIGLHYLICSDQTQAQAAWELFVNAIVNQYALQ